MEELFLKSSTPSVSTYFVALEANSPCNGFYDDACYNFYLLRLFHCLNYYHVKLHAYLLLPDKLWLLVTPGSISGIRNLLDCVNRVYCDYFNSRFARTISRWHKKSTGIAAQEDSVVLVCQKYIESEPVRNGIVGHAGAWHWSSYSVNAFGGRSNFLTKHRAFRKFLQQGSDPGSRYRAYVARGLMKGECRQLQPLLLCGSG